MAHIPGHKSPELMSIGKDKPKKKLVLRKAGTGVRSAENTQRQLAKNRKKAKKKKPKKEGYFARKRREKAEKKIMKAAGKEGKKTSKGKSAKKFVTTERAKITGKVSKKVVGAKVTKKGGAFPIYKEGSKTSKSFKATFKDARKKHGGGGGTFEWEGRKYTTDTAGDVSKRKKAKKANKANSIDKSPGSSYDKTSGQLTRDINKLKSEGGSVSSGAPNQAETNAMKKYRKKYLDDGSIKKVK